MPGSGLWASSAAAAAGGGSGANRSQALTEPPWHAVKSAS